VCVLGTQIHCSIYCVRARAVIVTCSKMKLGTARTPPLSVSHVLISMDVKKRRGRGI
jgi:hypothetical protein